VLAAELAAGQDWPLQNQLQFSAQRVFAPLSRHFSVGAAGRGGIFLQ
jgi:hypothetical protein